MKLFEIYPTAEFCLIDLSSEMLAIAEKRFAGLKNFSFLTQDYLKTIPDNCDVITSALSIHHLTNDEKKLLYSRVYQTLPENGLFINLDQFSGSSQRIAQAYNEIWMRFIDESEITPDARDKWLMRKKLDIEISMEETTNMLRSVGFRMVECIYSNMKFGAVLAEK